MSIIESINETISNLGIVSDLLEKLVSTVLIVIAGVIIIKILLAMTEKSLNRSRHLDKAVHTFIINSEKVAGGVMLIIMIISHLGVPTTPLVTLLGACGAAVALALKDSLGNFAGGILIIMTQIFSRGDYIEIGGVAGKVQEIDLLYTRLLTVDNRLVNIPNGSITTGTVINYSAEPTRRIDCKFGIGYECDIEQAKDIIRKIVDESEYYLKDPAPVIGVAEHGDNAVIIDALIWCSNPDYFPAKYNLQEEVKYAFDREGINIPYPQVTVHYEAEAAAAEEN